VGKGLRHYAAWHAAAPGIGAMTMRHEELLRQDGARRRGQGIDLRRAYTPAFVKKHVGIDLDSAIY
jgi:hypothetical protein